MSLTEAANPRAVIGANKPPLTPYEAVALHIEDLLIEARNWADGQAVETPAQADAVARLIDDLRAAERAADDARKAEVAPLDEARDVIQAKFNVYIAPLKNKTPGKIPLAMAALKAAQTPWLQKLEDEQRAKAEAARAQAEAAAKTAAEAMRAADASNLAAREAAELLVAKAERAAADAKHAEGLKAHAKGDGKAMRLRSYFTPVMIEPREALRHYLIARTDDVKAFLLRLAVEDVAAGKRQIPGFRVDEDRRVA